ncbi:PadR family transcriptional regulator [Mycoplasmatota bacterium]|nr:PadR family transcriptional regulator [Mycoplasmatota bacterium]
MSTQLKKGVLELCVLNILENQDSYGYDIYQAVNEKMMISESTIYPILRKLVKEGLCTTYLKESTEGPPRKYFKTTEMGNKKLDVLKNNWINFCRTVNLMIGCEKG